MNTKLGLYIDESLDSENWIKEYLTEVLRERVSLETRSNDYLLGINIFDEASTPSNENQLNLQFSGANLNFFKESHENIFKFKNLEDLKMLEPNILKYIDKSIKSLTNDLILLSNTSYKNLTMPEEIIDNEKIYLEVLGCSNYLELKYLIEKKYSDFQFISVYNLQEKHLTDRIYLFEQHNSFCLVSSSQSLDIDWIIVKSIKDFLNKIRVIKNHKNTKDFAHIFIHLPYPVAILNLRTNTYDFNTEFSNLGINTKELNSYSDNQNIEVKSMGKMKVIKTKLSDDFLSISFIKIEKLEVNFSDQSQEELGIVSSSIAHELNNPLGGILAALDVLLLDDNSPEVEEEFTQMKSGVQRCKELVETFLSFSRKKQVDMQSNLSVNQIFDQVIQLSRFRLIESNNQIKLDFTQLRENKYIKNSHLMTMCLYLIVGDLLTVSSRDELLKQTVLSGSLNLKVAEDIDKITIELDQVYMLSVEFLNSKLFNYITDILKIKILEKKHQKILSFY